MMASYLLFHLEMSRRTSTSARLITTALFTTLLHASAWPEAAMARPVEAGPRFHIQAIEVRGARHVSTPLVAAESLLQPGRVYTESELRDAIARIRRLPFVVEADFALDRGHQRGTYVLLVDIVETRRLFYQADLHQSYFGQPLAIESSGLSDHNLASSTAVGARFFVGSHDEVFAAAGNTGVQLGYTRYNLFGRGITVHFGLAREASGATSITPLGLDPALSTWIDDADADSALLNVAIPFGVYQWVQAGFTWRQGEAGLRRPALGRFESAAESFRNRTEKTARLAWNYDSTDDPIGPSRGTSWVVAVGYGTQQAELFEADAEVEMSSEFLRLSVLGRRHWPLAERHSFAAGLSLAAGHSQIENLATHSLELGRESFDSWEVTATIRHTQRFHEAKTARIHHRVYWQNQVEYTWNSHSSLNGISTAVLDTDSVEIAKVSSALVLHGAWGILRLGLQWVQVGDAP